MDNKIQKYPATLLQISRDVLLEHVFAHFNFKELSGFALINKEYYEIMQGDVTWNVIMKKEFQSKALEALREPIVNNCPTMKIAFKRLWAGNRICDEMARTHSVKLTRKMARLLTYENYSADYGFKYLSLFEKLKWVEYTDYMPILISSHFNEETKDYQESCYRVEAAHKNIDGFSLIGPAKIIDSKVQFVGKVDIKGKGFKGISEYNNEGVFVESTRYYKRYTEVITPNRLERTYINGEKYIRQDGQPGYYEFDGLKAEEIQSVPHRLLLHNIDGTKKIIVYDVTEKRILFMGDASCARFPPCALMGNVRMEFVREILL